jgi:hypothetical protein
VLPPWFKVLSATAQADEHTRRITGLLEGHCCDETDRILVVARKLADAGATGPRSRSSKPWNETMKHADHDHQGRREHRRVRGRRPLQNNAGSDRRWIESKDVRLADEIRYIQQRAAERDTRIVTIGPLLLFSAESGDAWVLDPADRLATRLADAGHPATRPRRGDRRELSVGWQGRYEIIGSAFVFTDNESGRVTTILEYPTRQIIQRIAEVFGC